MSAPHLTPDEFREQGHRVVDWIADYWESVDEMPVLAQVQPGDVTASLPDRAAGAAGAARGRAGGPGRAPRPRADALAAPTLLRVLPGELLARRRAGRPALQRHRRPGDVVGDQPGRDRARAGRPRPAPPGARPAGLVRAGRPGRGRHPGHRLDRDVHRRPGRAAPRDRWCGPSRRRTRRGLRDLRLHPGPLVAAQGRDDERSRRGRRPLDRRRPGDAGHGRRRAARGDGGRRGRRASGRCWCSRRSGRRPPARSTPRRPSPWSRRSTAPGCTSTPHGRASPRSVPSTAGSTTASSTPTPTSPTRTSGC